MATLTRIAGFLSEPLRTATGATYAGRLQCHGVQWTGRGDDRFATFALSAREVADAAESQMLWTDQDVQRGVKPGLESQPERELPVSAGYPDESRYVFNSANADEICEKLLQGDQLFLSPLIWNLRPGTFEAFWDEGTATLHIYDGKIYLPDSHHRHQAILKAVRLYRESRESYPQFDLDRQFAVELYFLSRADEGDFFFDKNQRPRPTALSKAYDLTTQDDLSVLAKRVVEASSALRANVNRVTDRLTAGNPQVVTLSTLREMMRVFAPHEVLDDVELDGLTTVASSFYDLLAEVRPELGKLPLSERKQIRKELLVDAAVMMHAYAHLMRSFNNAIGEGGFDKAVREWRARLERISSATEYSFGDWEGELFARANPLWEAIGVIKKNPDGKSTVQNTGGVRARAGKALLQLLTADPVPRDLRFLVAS